MGRHTRWMFSPQRIWFLSLVICLPLLGLSILSILYFDASLALYFLSNYGKPSHLLSRQLTNIGKADWYFILSGGGLVLSSVVLLKLKTGIWQERWVRARTWSTYLLLSLLAGGILVQILKHLIGRQRPYAESVKTGLSFDPLSTNYEFHSFPSGHTQVMFSVATALAILFPRLWWLWMGFASVIGATRALTLNHWVGDVLAGAAVGIFGTLLVFKLLRKRLPV
ncbi:MAG: phosphatase PAP2 family protein [Bdellovibrionales bacterium]|jgi:membrane-associated phospholipid phosphatase|nr:phosphatase PAP2 family protein [Bdellovibrionales bacterium]